LRAGWDAPGLGELKRGQLLHGPPGTGKSRMSALLLRHLGLEPVAPIMTAGEFTAPYKGVVEQAVRRAASRR
jgi:MoxR-like ATPase